MSPWALTWDDENYYLIAYDEEADCIKHFRVDKIKNIRILDKKRSGRDKFKEFNLPEYAKMSFSMFGGEKKRVKLAFKDELSYDTDKVEYKQTVPADYKLILKYMEQVRQRYEGEVSFVCGYEAGWSKRRSGIRPKNVPATS